MEGGAFAYFERAWFAQCAFTRVPKTYSSWKWAFKKSYMKVGYRFCKGKNQLVY